MKTDETSWLSGKPDAALEDRLLTEASRRMQENLLNTARIMLAGFDPEMLDWMRSELRALGLWVVDAAPAARDIRDVVEIGPAFDHLVINLDAFEDAEAGVDALLPLRARCGDAIIVLVSASVSGDDFGCERRAICDATLRAPASASRIKQALVAGILKRRRNA